MGEHLYFPRTADVSREPVPVSARPLGPHTMPCTRDLDPDYYLRYTRSNQTRQPPLPSLGSEPIPRGITTSNSTRARTRRALPCSVRSGGGGGDIRRAIVAGVKAAPFSATAAAFVAYTGAVLACGLLSWADRRRSGAGAAEDAQVEIRPFAARSREGESGDEAKAGGDGARTATRDGVSSASLSPPPRAGAGRNSGHGGRALAHEEAAAAPAAAAGTPHPTAARVLGYVTSGLARISPRSQWSSHSNSGRDSDEARVITSAILASCSSPWTSLSSQAGGKATARDNCLYTTLHKPQRHEAAPPPHTAAERSSCDTGHRESQGEPNPAPLSLMVDKSTCTRDYGYALNTPHSQSQTPLASASSQSRSHPQASIPSRYSSTGSSQSGVRSSAVYPGICPRLMVPRHIGLLYHYRQQLDVNSISTPTTGAVAVIAGSRMMRSGRPVWDQPRAMSPPQAWRGDGVKFLLPVQQLLSLMLVPEVCV